MISDEILEVEAGGFDKSTFLDATELVLFLCLPPKFGKKWLLKRIPKWKKKEDFLQESFFFFSFDYVLFTCALIRSMFTLRELISSFLLLMK